MINFAKRDVAGQLAMEAMILVAVVAFALVALVPYLRGGVAWMWKSASDQMSGFVPYGLTPAPALTLNASPLTIVRGQATTLTWNGANVTSCTASGGWSGSRTISGSQAVSPTVTTIYRMTCSGPVGSVSRFITVTVVT